MNPNHEGIYTFMDCPDYTPIDEDIGGWCTNSDGDFTMCGYGCREGLCPRGYAR